MKENKTLFLVQFSILIAIEAIFSFTILGSIPIGPVVATLGMIPVIIAALLFGPKVGSLLGVIGGLFSVIVFTFMPPTPMTAFIFSPFYSLGEFQGNFGSLLISFVPRILVGAMAGLSYQWLSKTMPKKDILCLAISAAVGSLMNTIGFLIGLWIFFAPQVQSIAGVPVLGFAVASIIPAGIAEAIISAIAAAAICIPVRMVLRQSRH